MGPTSNPEWHPTAASSFDMTDEDWEGEPDKDKDQGEAVGCSSKLVLDGKFYNSLRTLALNMRFFRD
jgi:hypothetical protein